MEHVLGLTKGITQQGQPQPPKPQHHAAALMEPEPEFLPVDELNESRLLEKTAYNIGQLYVGGIAMGSGIGVVKGIKNAQKGSYKLVLNSIFNSAGKLSVRSANMFGSAALFYHLIHLFLEKVAIGDNFYNGPMAGALAGFLFRSPRGLKRAFYGIFPGILIGIAMEMHDKKQLKKFKWRETLEFAKESTPYLNKLAAGLPPSQQTLKPLLNSSESIADSVEGYDGEDQKME